MDPEENPETDDLNEPENPEEDDPETDPEEDEPEEDPFDGEFDAKRARRTIDKLRAEVKAAKQKANQPKDTAETSKLRQENLRLSVALDLGLPKDLANRLRGDTEEELIEDASALLELLSPSDKKKTPEKRQPTPRLKGGTDPEEEPELTADQIVAAATSR